MWPSWASKLRRLFCVGSDLTWSACRHVLIAFAQFMHQIGATGLAQGKPRWLFYAKTFLRGHFAARKWKSTGKRAKDWIYHLWRLGLTASSASGGQILQSDFVCPVDTLTLAWVQSGSAGLLFPWFSNLRYWEFMCGHNSIRRCFRRAILVSAAAWLWRRERLVCRSHSGNGDDWSPVDYVVNAWMQSLTMAAPCHCYLFWRWGHQQNDKCINEHTGRVRDLLRCWIGIWGNLESAGRECAWKLWV